MANSRNKYTKKQLENLSIEELKRIDNQLSVPSKPTRPRPLPPKHLPTQDCSTERQILQEVSQLSSLEEMLSRLEAYARNNEPCLNMTSSSTRDVVCGDFNGDSIVNILDIMILINIILDGTGYPDSCHDTVGHGGFNILNVVQMVNYLLGNNPNWPNACTCNDEPVYTDYCGNHFHTLPPQGTVIDGGTPGGSSGQISIEQAIATYGAGQFHPFFGMDNSTSTEQVGNQAWIGPVGYTKYITRAHNMSLGTANDGYDHQDFTDENMAFNLYYGTLYDERPLSIYGYQTIIYDEWYENWTHCGVTVDQQPDCNYIYPDAPDGSMTDYDWTPYHSTGGLTYDCSADWYESGPSKPTPKLAICGADWSVNNNAYDTDGATILYEPYPPDAGKICATCLGYSHDPWGPNTYHTWSSGGTTQDKIRTKFGHKTNTSSTSMYNYRTNGWDYWYSYDFTGGVRKGLNDNILNDQFNHYLVSGIGSDGNWNTSGAPQDVYMRGDCSNWTNGECGSHPGFPNAVGNPHCPQGVCGRLTGEDCGWSTANFYEWCCECHCPNGKTVSHDEICNWSRNEAYTNYQDYDGSPGGDVGSGTSPAGSGTDFCGSSGGYGPNIVGESSTENREWAAAWCNYDCEDWCSRHSVKRTWDEGAPPTGQFVDNINNSWTQSPIYALDYPVTPDPNYLYDGMTPDYVGNQMYRYYMKSNVSIDPFAQHPSVAYFDQPTYSDDDYNDWWQCDAGHYSWYRCGIPAMFYKATDYDPCTNGYGHSHSLKALEWIKHAY